MTRALLFAALSLMTATSVFGLAEIPSRIEATLPFAGMTIVSVTGRVEVREPGKPQFQPPPEVPLPLGVGMSLRTGMLSRARIEFEDESIVEVGAHSLLRIGNPTCQIEEGRLEVAAAPRQIVEVQTGPEPVRIRGPMFSVQVPGRGKARMGALGNGRAAAAQLLAVKGFVEAQLPLGTVRAEQTPITLHEGSVVQTGANSYALIVFPDGSRVKLRADSAASVDGARQCTIAAGAADVQTAEKGELELRTINQPAWIRGAAFIVWINHKDETEPPRQEATRAFRPPEAARTGLPGESGWDGGGR